MPTSRGAVALLTPHFAFVGAGDMFVAGSHKCSIVRCLAPTAALL
jgi:hypothetical protein